MRRNINNKKYDKIRSLLKSSNKQDILIGIALLKKYFDHTDFCRNFPNNHLPHDFICTYEGFFWVELFPTFIAVSVGVIYVPFPQEETLNSWRNMFKNEEIKL